MSHRPPTPEEILKRIFTPFEADEEFELELDRELERTLAMTPEAIRADLAEMGYDVAALERQARAFLGLGKKKRNRLGLVALVGAPLAATVIELLAPNIPELLPMAAHAPDDPPAVTGAAPPDFTPEAADAAARTNNPDGGSR